MTSPVTHGRRRPAWRLTGIGLLAIGVAAALHATGRLIQPSSAFSLLGADPIPAKSLLATIALALAGVQVLLALWMYRKLPLAARPPRPGPVVHRVTGFALVAVTVPVAVHCLIAYGAQLTSPRVAIESIAAIANGWVTITSPGGPTPDKPGVTLEPPPDPGRASGFMNIRVADAVSQPADWPARAAKLPGLPCTPGEAWPKAGPHRPG